MRRTALMIFAACALGCSRAPTSGDAVIVAHIVVGAEVLAPCVQLAVLDPSPAAADAGVLALQRFPRPSGKNEFYVGIYRGNYPATIHLIADARIGGGASNCDEPSTMIAVSATESGTFSFGSEAKVDLLIDCDAGSCGIADSDAGSSVDAGPSDAGRGGDAGAGADAAPETDASSRDAGSLADAGAGPDSGALADAGSPPDAGPRADAGTPADAGVDAGAACTGNCNGCCNNGTCVGFGGLSTSECGQNGAACVACDSSSDNCNGGSCACGFGPPCAGGLPCSNGNCQCNATVCPNGCCGFGGSCNVSAYFACGTGGGACANCFQNRGTTCVSGTCTACTGCIDDTGTCQSGNTNTVCGSGGGRCQACGTGSSCQSGQCM
jgi:hypothetical protein